MNNTMEPQFDRFVWAHWGNMHALNFWLWGCEGFAKDLKIMSQILCLFFFVFLNEFLSDSPNKTETLQPGPNYANPWWWSQMLVVTDKITAACPDYYQEIATNKQ